MGSRLAYLLMLLIGGLGHGWPLSGQMADTPPAARSAPAAPRLASSDQELARFFDQYMRSKMRQLEIPGGAMVVVRGGRTILSRGYGVVDLKSGRPIDVDDSLFRAASISKIIPWMLVMQLVEEGRLDLDRDVNAYLDFRIPDAFGKPITMRHLMTHSAGFAERFHGAFDSDLTTPLGVKLSRNIPERAYAPGTTMAYSNYGAALAGHVVERLRGRPWKALVEDRFFEPIGMRRSTIAQPVPPALQASLVATYEPWSNEPAAFRSTPLVPMGALSATPADMGRLLLAISRGGRGAKGHVVAPETMSEMLALQRPVGPGLPDGMGLGFMVGEYRGVRHGGHGGNMSTLATDLSVLPDHDLGWYFVLSAQGPGEEGRDVRSELLHSVIDRFLAPGPLALEAHGPSSASDVAGPYLSTRRIFSGPIMFSGLMNSAQVTADPDGSLSIEWSGKVTKWLPAGRDRFVDEASGIPLAVSRDSDGKVERIASAALYPVAEFEPQPAFARLVPYAAVFAFATILLAIPARGISWALRRRRTRSEPRPSQGKTGIRHEGRAGRWSRIAFWGIVATIVSWAVFALCLAIDFSTLFTLPSLLRIGLGLLTLLSLPFALILVADALLAWRDPVARWPEQAGLSLLAAAAACLALLFYSLDVVNFSADW